MANYTNLNDLFTDMANAIRAKTGSTVTIIADSFPTEIESLRTGFDYSNQEVTSIPDYAFYGCEDLNSVDCYGLTSIGVSAFEGCNNLKNIILYDSVESIGEDAFKGCSCLIYYKGNSIPETWHENWNPDECIVLCGELVETWDISDTENDNVIAKLYSNGDKYTLFISGNGRMKDYSSNSSTHWYNYRADITSIIIGNNVTSIDDSAFSGCRALTSITIPDGVTSIGAGVFSGCTKLTSITIPDSVTSIGGSAFSKCTSLTSITIPDSVTSIGTNAFSGCSGLTSITIPDSVTSIGSYAFQNCSGLTSITIPDSVTSIATYAFQNCSGLTSITIPDSVTSIGTYAFQNCSGLTSITFTGSIEQWNAITFGTLWNGGTGKYTIHCTDGTIAKDGTVTYYES